MERRLFIRQTGIAGVLAAGAAPAIGETSVVMVLSTVMHEGVSSGELTEIKAQSSPKPPVAGIRASVKPTRSPVSEVAKPPV